MITNIKYGHNQEVYITHYFKQRFSKGKNIRTRKSDNSFWTWEIDFSEYLYYVNNFRNLSSNAKFSVSECTVFYVWKQQISTLLIRLCGTQDLKYDPKFRRWIGRTKAFKQRNSKIALKIKKIVFSSYRSSSMAFNTW